MRPGWDDYFLGIAAAVSRRADCSRAQHGAVIVKNHRIVATGYNGTPAGDRRSCLAGDCPRVRSNAEHNRGSYENCINLHAEQNAIAHASYEDTEGATLYITGQPCDMCLKLIAAAGIKEIVQP